MRKTYKQGVEDGKAEILKEGLDKHLASLLKSVDPNDVFTADKSGQNLYLGKRVIETRELQELKGDVTYFKKSNLWKVINETVRWLAMEVMFTKSESFEDMRQGKAYLHALSVFENIIFRIENTKIDIGKK